MSQGSSFFPGFMGESMGEMRGTGVILDEFEGVEDELISCQSGMVPDLGGHELGNSDMSTMASNGWPSSNPGWQTGEQNVVSVEESSICAHLQTQQQQGAMMGQIEQSARLQGMGQSTGQLSSNELWVQPHHQEHSQQVPSAAGWGPCSSPRNCSGSTSVQQQLHQMQQMYQQVHNIPGPATQQVGPQP